MKDSIKNMPHLARNLDISVSHTTRPLFTRSMEGRGRNKLHMTPCETPWSIGGGRKQWPVALRESRLDRCLHEHRVTMEGDRRYRGFRTATQCVMHNVYRALEDSNLRRWQAISHAGNAW